MKIIKTRIMPVIVFIMLGFMIIGHTQLVAATDPSDMNLAYVYETQTLLVEINHATSDMESHYIARLEVSVNSILNQTKDYTSQPNIIGMSDSFVVPAVEGDVISVKAICSVSGQLTETLTLTEPVTFTTSTTTTTTIPTNTSSSSPSGFDPILIIVFSGALVLVVSIIVIVIKRK